MRATEKVTVISRGRCQFALRFILARIVRAGNQLYIHIRLVHQNLHALSFFFAAFLDRFITFYEGPRLW